MFRLVESIKVLDGAIHNLEYHQERMDRSVYTLTGRRNLLSLFDELFVSEEFSYGLYKCRVVYSDRIELVEFIPYRRRDIRSLQIVHGNIDYSCKYEDRSVIDELFRKRGECDDILIIKNGLVTDTSFSNIAFSDGKTWYTPAEPLLEGTRRSRLVAERTLEKCNIKPDDMKNFICVSMINAMADLGEIVIPVDKISG